jgi:hydrogenase maturation factor
MGQAVAKKIKEAQSSYYFGNIERKEWVLVHIGQAVATVAQITWTESCELAINDIDENPMAL